jgi:hypothetical protein
MIANPSDLTAGVSEPGIASAEASPAVKRLFAGRRHPLPVVNASTIGGTAAPAGDQSPGAAADQTR